MPNIALNEVKTYKEVRDHFILRLKERYDISLTYPEYDSLFDNLQSYPFDRIYAITSNIILVWVEIKGKKVLALYGKKQKGYRRPCLLTCLRLSEDLHLPTPRIFSINGYTPQQFESIINQVIRDVFHLVDDYMRLGREDFFKLNPSKLMYKSATHYWVRDGEIDLNHIINFVIKDYLKEGLFRTRVAW